MVVMAWRNTRHVAEPRPIPTPLPEWGELRRIATRPSDYPLSGLGHELIVILDRSCRGCEEIADAIATSAVGVNARIAFIQHDNAFGDDLEKAVSFECLLRGVSRDAVLRGLAVRDPVGVATAAAPSGTVANNSACREDSATSQVVRRQVGAVRQIGISLPPAVLLDGFVLYPPITAGALDSLKRLVGL